MNKTHPIIVSSFFATLTFLGAQLAIYVGPVPITFQTFFVILAGLIGGAEIGLISQLIYLALGFIGLPVFAGFRGGLTVLVGPTAGYLFSFPAASVVAGLIFNPTTDRVLFRGFLACIASEVIIYLVGVPWLIFWLSSFGGIQVLDALYRAVVMGALIFLPGDGLKILLTLYIINRKDVQEIMIKIRT